MILRETHIIGARTAEKIVTASACPDLERHQIVLAGLSSARSGFSFVRERPVDSVTISCLSGRGWAWVRGSWLPCGPGDVYIAPPGHGHAYRAEAKGSWEIAWIVHRGQQSAATEPNLRAFDGHLLSQAISGLYREVTFNAQGEARALWCGLIDNYARHSWRTVGFDHRLTRLWETVSADLSASWDVAELARLAAMSPEHLRRLCQITYQSSPKAYLTQLRMQRAQALLVATPDKMDNIAAAVGYENTFAFSTAFRRHWGYPPSHLRNQPPR